MPSKARKKKATKKSSSKSSSKRTKDLAPRKDPKGGARRLTLDLKGKDQLRPR